MRKRIIAAVLGIVLLAGGFAGGYVARDNFWLTGGKQDFTSLNDLKTILKSSFDGTVDESKLLDGAKAGIASALGDPYTVYLTKDEAKTLADDLSGTFSGIGAEIGIRNNKLVIIAPLADTPAAKAGLKAQDQIIKIDDTDPSGLSLDEAVAKIRGQEGTTVRLTIVRGSAAPQEFTITRTTINQPSVKSSLKDGGIGYIQVIRFGSDTATLVRSQAQDLLGQGATRFVLDLRNDPGGYLDAAVDVAGQFVANKVIVEERKGTTSIDKLSSDGGGLLVGKKTIVLINGGSASASEIVAGALQDYGVATIVGEKSFGKGSVQEIKDLGDGSELKVTIAHWYTPNGKNISKEGIKPDVEVKLEQADFDAARDPQLDKALELLK